MTASGRLSLVLTLLTTSMLCSCSNHGSSSTTIEVNDNRLSWAAVADADGIKSIAGLQRIPSGSGYLVYDVDFKFDKVGAKTYDIFIGGMFDVVGTAVHVEVTDMKNNAAYLFIRSTAQGHQIGTYRKQ